MKSILHFILSRFVRLRTTSPGRVERILVNVSAGIGDAIMAEPLLRALRKSFPAAHLAVLCSPACHDLFRSHSAVNRTFVMPESIHARFRMVLSLRRQAFDVFIGAIPSNTLRHVLIPFLAGIGCRIKHASPHQGSNNYDFLFHSVLPLDLSRHRVLANLDLLDPLGAESFVDQPRIDVDPSMRSAVRERLVAAGWSGVEPLVGFHAGCNPAAIEKRWDPNRFAEVGQFLMDRGKAVIILIGGPDELDENRLIANLLGRKVVDLVGRLNLLESAAAIQHCAFFLSNDSGIMHLATAAGIPTFAVFGPKDERHIGPFGRNHEVIRCGSRVNEVEASDVIKRLQDSENGLNRLINRSEP